MKKLLGILIVVMTCSLSTTVEAINIWENGEPIGSSFGNVSDLSAPFGLAGQQSADNFSLKTFQNTIKDIHWWGSYFEAPLEDSFTIKIFESTGPLDPWDPNSSVPDPITGILVGNFGTNEANRVQSLTDPGLYSYFVDIEEITLDVDKEYWLSIVNNTPSMEYWSWSISQQVFFPFESSVTFDGANWVRSPNQLAFNLTGPAIPEPTTILLSGLGLLGMGIYIRKRKK